MTKLVNPLFGFDAHGSVGDEVTFQSSNEKKYARKKPRLPYCRSLAQVYQRWLYEDYYHLWRQQTQAVKDLFRTSGVRQHLTAYQAWMKYMLTNLPDICGMWHLDEKSGTVARDSSRNGNDGVVTGDYPADGLIDGGFYFDWSDNVVVVPTSPSLWSPDTLTVEMFIYLLVMPGWAPSCPLINTGSFFLYDMSFFSLDFEFYILIGGVEEPHPSWDYMFIDRWYHVAATYDKDAGADNLRLYVNGQLKDAVTRVGSVDAPTGDFFIGLTGWDYWFGKADHVVYYNRVLDEAEILRHSLRRYPAA